MTLVAGVDSSTQSTKVVVCDAETGRGRPRGPRAAPRRHRGRPRGMVAGLAEATATAVCSTASRRSPSAASSTAWCCRREGEPVRHALLWNDTRSAAGRRDLIAELGGPQAWADATGLVPGRQLHRHQAALGGRARARRWPRARAACCSPTTGSPAGSAAAPRGADHRPRRRVRHRLLVAGDRRLPPRPAAAAVRPRLAVPAVAAPEAVVGEAAGEAAAVRRRRSRPAPATTWAPRSGLGLEPGDVVSRSAPAAPCSPSPSADRRPRGIVAGVRRRHRPVPAAGVHAQRRPGDRRRPRHCSAPTWPASTLALAAPAGADGLMLLPYLDGERTPDLPDATGALHGLTRANATPGAPGPRGGRGHAAAASPTPWTRCAPPACPRGGCCSSAVPPRAR